MHCTSPVYCLPFVTLVTLSSLHSTTTPPYLLGFQYTWPRRAVKRPYSGTNLLLTPPCVWRAGWSRPYTLTILYNSREGSVLWTQHVSRRTRTSSMATPATVIALKVIIRSRISASGNTSEERSWTRHGPIRETLDFLTKAAIC